MLDLGTEGKHLMEIVAFDTDDRADGQGKAGITWISKTVLNSNHVINATQKTVDGETAWTAGGWENSDMRLYLKNTIKPLIPSTVRNAIVEVNKISSTYTGGTKVSDGQTTTDDVWIPSAIEVGELSNFESKYSYPFTKTRRLKKSLSGYARQWATRTVATDSKIVSVKENGDTTTIASATSSYHYCIALGFCTN